VSRRDHAAWLRVQRRAAALSPALRLELLEAYRVLRESVSDAELASLIANGQWDRVLDDALLDRAFLPLREKLQQAVERGLKSTLPDLPNAGQVNGSTAVGFNILDPRVIEAVRQLDSPAVGFNILDPRVIEAVRQLDSRVINTLKDEVRETVRAYIEQGLRTGVHPREIARDLRPILGLGPTQAQHVLNYRAELKAGSKAALDRKLRDKRFDRAVSRGMTEGEIDKAVAAYERKYIKFNAETNARTATLDALKLGQQLSWQGAITKGIVDPATLFQRWVTVGDDRVREEHQAMNGEEIKFGGVFSNGETVPGESTWNCRCIARVFVKPVAKPFDLAA
jgi:hypothetical protein